MTTLEIWFRRVFPSLILCHQYAATF